MSIDSYFKKELDKHLEAINTEVIRLMQENGYLRQRLQDFRKDDEIRCLEDEIKKIRHNSLAILTDVEMDELSKFRNHHMKNCSMCRIQYSLDGVGIGTVIGVKCTTCGEEKDITDYESW